MKWIILIWVIVGEFILIASLIIGFIYVPKITFVLSIPTYFVWKSLGGLNNWKLSTIKTFLRNWDNINAQNI